MSRAEVPWSAPVVIADIPDAGLNIKLHADEATRNAVARAAGVDALARLDASFDLLPQARDEVRVVGAVSATVKQTCVVTLEPVLNEVVEEVDLVFAPVPRTAGLQGGGLDETDYTEMPEPLIGGAVDLGAIATEFLVLGIDPYPRKPGAVFEPARDAQDAGGPFAALAALKGKGRGPAA